MTTHIISKGKALHSHSLVVMGLFLLLGITFSSCDASEGKDSSEEQQTVSNAQLSTQVAIDTAQKAAFFYTLTANGKVEASAQTTLMAPRSAFLRQLLVQVGDFVQKGQSLASFNTDALQLEKERAQLALTKAQLEFENTLIGFPSLMQKEGTQKDSLLLRLRVSSGLGEAELRLKEIQQELNNSYIKAPFAGVIYDQKVSEGAYLQSGQEIMSIYSPQPMLLKTQLLETEASMLKKGMPAKVKTAQMEEKSALNGKVYAINPVVNESGLVEVVISLNKAEANTWLGMNATATIMIPQGERLLVPKEAVVLRSGKAVVFSKEKDLAKWNYVETGLDNGRQVEILKGIEAGQVVITTNNLQLAHDAPVAVNTEND